MTALALTCGRLLSLAERLRVRRVGSDTASWHVRQVSGLFTKVAPANAGFNAGQSTGFFGVFFPAAATHATETASINAAASSPVFARVSANASIQILLRDQA